MGASPVQLAHRALMTWDPHLMPRAFATCFATVVVCALLPAAAGASVSLSSVSIQPTTTQAGGHPNVTIDTVFGLNPDTDDVKSVRVFLPKIFLESAVTSDASTNYGLSSTFDDLPRTSGPFDIRITEMKLTLAGAAAHGPFVTNPTGCGPATMTASATSYDQPTVVVS